MSKEIVAEKVKNYRPHNLVDNLPTSSKERIRLVDMSWTLEEDMPDGKGGILYPAGYTFNPLDYTSLRAIYIFINGDDERQVNWFKKSPYAKDIRTKLILAGGEYWKLQKDLNRQVFYLSKIMADRFQLDVVPSIVVQKKSYVQVKEISEDELNED